MSGHNKHTNSKSFDQTWPEGAWIPVRKGGLYCSPACGGKCTFAAFETATKRAAALAAEAGDGWVPRVHENLGWYYAAEKGPAQLRTAFFSTGKEYDLLINPKGLHSIIVVGSTVKECLESARTKVQEIINQAQSLMEILK